MRTPRQQNKPRSIEYCGPKSNANPRRKLKNEQMRQIDMVPRREAKQQKAIKGGPRDIEEKKGNHPLYHAI
jgi:hypothetical protein